MPGRRHHFLFFTQPVSRTVGRYIANPYNGYSNHSRGNCVDITLVTAEGDEIPMPTGFDDFTAMADRDYSDVPEAAAENALLLEHAMTDAGFIPYSAEWWHFTDETDYGVAEDFDPAGQLEELTVSVIGDNILVVGSHPHILQEIEVYKGTPIAYSLGNFVYGGARQPDRDSMILSVSLYTDPSDGSLCFLRFETISVHVYSGALNNYRPVQA